MDLVTLRFAPMEIQRKNRTLKAAQQVKFNTRITSPIMSCNKNLPKHSALGSENPPKKAISLGGRSNPRRVAVSPRMDPGELRSPRLHPTNLLFFTSQVIPSLGFDMEKESAQQNV